MPENNVDKYSEYFPGYKRKNIQNLKSESIAFILMNDCINLFTSVVISSKVNNEEKKLLKSSMHMHTFFTGVIKQNSEHKKTSATKEFLLHI